MVSYSQICFFYSFTVQYFNGEVVYINCVFDSSIARICIRTVDEKQEMFEVSVLCSLAHSVVY